MRAVIIHADGKEAALAAQEVARGFGIEARLLKAEKVRVRELRSYDVIVICASIGFFGVSGDINRLMYRLAERKLPGKVGAVVGVQKRFGFMAEKKLSRIRYGLENMGLKVSSDILVQEGKLQNQEHLLRTFGRKLKENTGSRRAYRVELGRRSVQNPMVIGFSEIEKVFDELFSRLFGRQKQVKPPKFREEEYEPEIIDRKKEITVLMEFKGVEEQDLEIRLENQDLVVKARDKIRRVVLPLVPKKFTHTFKNGVLEVILQKP